MDKRNPDKNQTTQLIKAKARGLGFTACGIARAEPVSAAEQKKVSQWLGRSYNGKMQFMANHFEKRMDPTLLVPGARSIICLALNYHQKNFQPLGSHYRVSQYAAGKDYHLIIKEKLHLLLEYIKEQTNVEVARVFTDSAPVLERYWAQKAGLGWTGKNACLIIPQKGSYFFLAEILLDVDLEYDNPFEKDYCGSCTRCLDYCPTGAITSPGVIDAQRCISYLTIELKDEVPEALQDKTEQYVFGCDICQEVCPHNIKFASPTKEKDLEALPALFTWEKEDWEQMEKSAFRKNFIKKFSPLSRAGYKKLANTIQMVQKLK